MVPFEGMEFDILHEARTVYNAYAFKMRFSIRIGSSRNSRVTNQLIRKDFECSHARITPSEKEDSASSNASPSVLGILNANRKIRKRTDTDVAFTQEYSRVSIFHRERECTN